MSISSPAAMRPMLFTMERDEEIRITADSDISIESKRFLEAGMIEFPIPARKAWAKKESQNALVLIISEGV